MPALILTTYDWVPEFPRGFVRDVRIRWALEEAGLPYTVNTTPFHDRAATHFAHQPFGQVPWLTDGDISIFESGAILLYLGERSSTLMPVDPAGRASVQQWLIAALNSLELASIPWFILQFSGEPEGSPARKAIDEFLAARVQHLEAVVANREWLAGAFSIADIAMADALRLVQRFDGLANQPACRDYIARATARPAFIKAHADQLAHFAAADAAASSAKPDD